MSEEANMDNMTAAEKRRARIKAKVQKNSEDRMKKFETTHRKAAEEAEKLVITEHTSTENTNKTKIENEVNKKKINNINNNSTTNNNNDNNQNNNKSENDDNTVESESNASSGCCDNSNSNNNGNNTIEQINVNDSYEPPTSTTTTTTTAAAAAAADHFYNKARYQQAFKSDLKPKTNPSSATKTPTATSHAAQEKLLVNAARLRLICSFLLAVSVACILCFPLYSSGKNLGYTIHFFLYEADQVFPNSLIQNLVSPYLVMQATILLAQYQISLKPLFQGNGSRVNQVFFVYGLFKSCSLEFLFYIFSLFSILSLPMFYVTVLNFLGLALLDNEGAVQVVQI